MFQVGDKVAYPMHGAGVIKGIEQTKVMGEEVEYFILKPCLGDLEIKIPVERIETIGLRYIVSEREADEVIDEFGTCECTDTCNWNKRYRENLEKLKAGNIFDVARITKSLIVRDRKKSLSNFERKMLSNAKNSLISELIMSKNSTYPDIEKLLMSKLP